MKLFLGVVTSAAGMVVELIKNLNDDTKTTHEVLRVLLPIIIPHYSLGKGLFDIGQNNLDARPMVYDAATGTVSPVGSKSWASVDVIGDDIAFLWGMCVAYGALILIIELSEGRISAFAARAASSFRRRPPPTPTTTSSRTRTSPPSARASPHTPPSISTPKDAARRRPGRSTSATA